MEKEDISVNIFIPEDGLLVSVSQKKRQDESEYWVVKFGGVVIFPDQDWLTYLATKIAVALPIEEQDKIIEAIDDNERILLEEKDA